MQAKCNSRPVAGVILLLLAVLLGSPLLCSRAIACLRDSLDDRTVQWSTEIVMAKLTAVNDPAAIDASPYQYQTYDFQVVESYDGPAKADDKITVIRFIGGADSQKSSICGQAFTSRQIGKSFVLFLRPESDLRWSDGGDADPRTSQIHDLKAFAVVHLESAYDLGKDGLEDAKYTITSTRQAEAQFKADDAKLQAQTMVNAADDTEESQAEHALAEMGPSVVPVLKAMLADAEPDAKARLLKVIRTVSPPSILSSMHQH